MIVVDQIKDTYRAIGMYLVRYDLLDLVFSSIYVLIAVGYLYIVTTGFIAYKKELKTLTVYMERKILIKSFNKALVVVTIALMITTLFIVLVHLLFII